MPKLSIKKADTDIYLDNVSLLLPFDSNFNDNSKNNYSVTLYGNPQISTAQSRYGGSSAYFDGGSAINIPTSLIQFDAGQNFTVECWVRLSSYGFRGVIGANTYGTFNITINPSGEVGVSRSNQAQLIASSTLINLNQWYHIAVTRDNGIIKLFINGQLNGSYTDNTIFSAPSQLQIGNLANEYLWWFYGYIDDFRITKGIARYTSNFTPPEKLAFTKVGNKLQISNLPPSILSSTYIRNTVLPILRSSITNFYNYLYDGGNSNIDDGGGDMYDGGNVVYLNEVIQYYNTESANTFCYTSYPFIYKTTQTSNFTLSVRGNYGSDGGETKYQYQQDFDYKGRKFSIYISESIDNSYDPSIVECFIVYYPNSKPTINFTYTGSNNDNGNQTIDVSNLNGQSVTAFYILLSTSPRYQIGSSTLFDVLKTFVVNSTVFITSKFKINKLGFPTNGLLAFWRLNNANGLSTISADFGNYTLQVGGYGYQSAVGKINNCFYFADSSKGLFTNQQILNQTNNPQSFSCTFWYKTPNSTNYVFTCGSAFGSLGFHFDYLGTQYQYSYGLGMKFSVATGNQNNGNRWGDLTVGSLFDANTWYHVVGTYDLVSQTMKLYINGSLVGTLSGVVSSGNEHPDWHGFGLNGSVRYNDKESGGTQWLDAVGIWNKALTQPEITALYYGGNGLEY
jgi:hypothetical protein